jgi:hypothetical protein
MRAAMGGGRAARGRSARSRLRRWAPFGAAAALVAAAAVIPWVLMIRMPGRSHAGALEPLGEEDRLLAEALRRDVTRLAADIGERCVSRPAGLRAAADFVAESLEAAGLVPRRHAFVAGDVTCENVEGEVAGRGPEREIVVLGAHYDAVESTVGANDNASGVAALLALSRSLARFSPKRTIRFVAFPNEEPPWFQTSQMGSLVYARACRERADPIVAMISLETIGYYSDAPGSQRYPSSLGWLYPSAGDFVAFVGDVGSRRLVREAIGVFRRTTRFPSQGAALPAGLPGVGWSDHWSFWHVGYPAIMVTDTAIFRYPHYHTRRDTPDKIDYERLARAVRGLERVVASLARAE